jgi:hypothetical protein
MPQVFDPRFNNIALTFAYLLPGGLPSSRTVTLRVREGEGETWLDPAVTPTLGSITQGTLTIASESITRETLTIGNVSFPRYAPLTMTLTGADLSFQVRQGQIINFALTDGDETMLRLYCTSPWSAALSYQLTWPADNSGQLKLVLTRINALDIDDVTGQPRQTSLELYRLAGSIVGLPGASRKVGATDVVKNDTVTLKRNGNGELRLQASGVRMEWDFAGGLLNALRVFDSRGKLASLRLPALAGQGSGVSAAFLDTLS